MLYICMILRRPRVLPRHLDSKGHTMPGGAKFGPRRSPCLFVKARAEGEERQKAQKIRSGIKKKATKARCKAKSDEAKKRALRRKWTRTLTAESLSCVTVSFQNKFHDEIPEELTEHLHGALLPQTKEMPFTKALQFVNAEMRKAYQASDFYTPPADEDEEDEEQEDQDEEDEEQEDQT
eukprot:SAG22_NODE_1464_length_4358_cov_537.962902_2_plen_179_part_00